MICAFGHLVQAISTLFNSICLLDINQTNCYGKTMYDSSNAVNDSILDLMKWTEFDWMDTHLFALSFGQRHSKSLADIINGTVFRTVVAAESCDFLNTDWIWILNLVDWYGESLAYRFGSRSTIRPMIAMHNSKKLVEINVNEH